MTLKLQNIIDIIDLLCFGDRKNNMCYSNTWKPLVQVFPFAKPVEEIGRLFVTSMPCPTPVEESMSSVSKEVEENFTVLRALGNGKFGQVRDVEHKVTKKLFAWKQLNLEEDPLSEVEAQMLRRVNHGIKKSWNSKRSLWRMMWWI